MFKPYTKTENPLKSLQKETRSINRHLSKLQPVMPTQSSSILLKKVIEKFDTLQTSWQALSSTASTSITSDKSQAKKYLHSLQISRKMLKNAKSEQKRIKSQEIILRKRELRLGRSLDKFKGLWQESLSDMESSLKAQKATLLRISEEYFSAMKKIEKEINEVLEVPTVPKLNLQKIESKSSKRICLSRKTSNEDCISHRSAFSLFSEDVASFRSYSSRIRKGEPRVSERKIVEENEKTNNFSGSFAKVNSEVLAESVSLNEIKEALFVLKKANLINNSGNGQLLKIAELIKDPDSTSNVELMLQLIEIENRKGRGPGVRIKAGPGVKSRLRIKKKKVDELDDTSREKFKFPEEKSFNRTLLSNENLLSPKNCEESFGAYGKEEFNDVKLEDLLNVASLMEDLGLVSADTSMINEIGTGIITDQDMKREREGFRMCDEVPVKISKKK